MTTAARNHPARTGRLRMIRAVGVLAAAGLVVAGLTAAPAQAADTGKITGQVFSQKIGGLKTPATDVYLYLSYSPIRDNGYFSVDSDPTRAGTQGYSFSGSTFELSNLKAGYYKFEVAGVADVDGVEFQREYYNDADSEGGATPIAVGTGTTTADDVVLEPAGQITGTITDRSGRPLPNASVSFEDSDRGGSANATTDAAGRFTSETDPADGYGAGLVRGDYRVSARLDDYSDPDGSDYEQRYWKNSTTYAGATAVTVVPGKTQTQVNIVLDVAPRIRLTVKDPSGQPVRNADVGIYTFYDNAWGPYQAGPNLTDDAGVFRKTVRIGDRYKFFIKPPAGVAGVTEWYDNAYTEATAKEVSATGYGQVRDITIQLGAAPGTPTPDPSTPAPTTPGPAPAPQAPPAPAPKRLNTSKVTIKGTPKVGRTLRASTRAWAPAPVTLSYTWYRNGKAVKGRSKATYKLRKADQGKRITVRVHQRKASYVTANRLSPKTAKVTKK